MAKSLARLEGLLRDLRIAISLCTRLPVAPSAVGEGDVARASWAFPIAGALIGLIAGTVYWLAERLHIAPSPASVLALAAGVLLTGAMHEDGLADTADGFGGGRTREKKLEIMRDSRIGTFGACALGLSLLLRWSALAALDNTRAVMVALIVAHGAARSVLPAFMSLVAPARSDGLSSGAGQPPPISIAVALGLGIVALSIGFGLGAMLTGVGLLAAIGILLALLARRQIGGQTGDVLGALEQTAEAALLLLATMLS
ncbi:MAG TPA: adenosylcobinamide-GDP ribazoletransferase [Bradyrhizobium sp.]|nr:adenosylcobinamide-GDP ribazoletransferase [Bradyrhizobium sp.]